MIMKYYAKMGVKNSNILLGKFLTLYGGWLDDKIYIVIIDIL